MNQTSPTEQTVVVSGIGSPPEDIFLDHESLPPLPSPEDHQLTIADSTNMSTHQRRTTIGPLSPLASPYPKHMPNGEQHYSKSYIPRRWMCLCPPANFGAVYHGQVFRSAFPGPENLGFLRTLKLKTIITLVDTELSPSYASFINFRGIRHYTIPTPANKESVEVTPELVFKVLGIIYDQRARPVLIHCNKGKHRTGCIVGALHKSAGWPLESVLEEYHTYAAPKAREHDELFLRSFDPHTMPRVNMANYSRAQRLGQKRAVMSLTMGTVQDEVMEDVQLASSPPETGHAEIDDSTSSYTESSCIDESDDELYEDDEYD